MPAPGGGRVSSLQGTTSRCAATRLPTLCTRRVLTCSRCFNDMFLLYERQDAKTLRALLNVNYRSHPDIVNFVGRNFYGQELKARAPLWVRNACVPALQFVHVEEKAEELEYEPHGCANMAVLPMWALSPPSCRKFGDFASAAVEEEWMFGESRMCRVRSSMLSSSARWRRTAWTHPCKAVSAFSMTRPC